MLVHNPQSYSRLCHALRETLEAHETRTVSQADAAKVKRCPDCQCVISLETKRKR